MGGLVKHPFQVVVHWFLVGIVKECSKCKKWPPILQSLQILVKRQLLLVETIGWLLLYIYDYNKNIMFTIKYSFMMQMFGFSYSYSCKLCQTFSLLVQKSRYILLTSIKEGVITPYQGVIIITPCLNHHFHIFSQLGQFVFS